jgi:hypothetical protein
MKVGFVIAVLPGIGIQEALVANDLLRDTCRHPSGWEPASILHTSEAKLGLERPDIMRGAAGACIWN